MENNYFVLIAKHKDDGFNQPIHYLGIYNCISYGIEQITIHKNQKYSRYNEEYDYFIFASTVNESLTMEEEHCVYSLTSNWGEEYQEYIDSRYMNTIEQPPENLNVIQM